MTTTFEPTPAHRRACRALDRFYGSRCAPGLLGRIDIDHVIALEDYESQMDAAWNEPETLERIATEMLEYMDCLN